MSESTEAETTEAETTWDGSIFGDQSRCFGCSPSHPSGLKLSFERHGDAVHTRFTPGLDHQGPPGIVHGGLVATIADELAAFTVVVLRGQMGFTAAFQGRLRGPLRVGKELTGIGRIAADRRRIVEIEIELAQEGATRFEGSFTFALLDVSGAERLLEAPLPEAWRRFCR